MMSANVKKRRRAKSGERVPAELVISHDLDVIDDEFLDPIELKRRAVEDANASFDKFSREFA